MISDKKWNEKTLQKFNYDKSMKYFPGNTIVHNIVNQSVLQRINEIVDDYKKQSFAEKLVFLPEDSYHMTLCDIIAYQNIKNATEDFRSNIYKGDITQTDHFIGNILKDIEFPKTIMMSLDYFDLNKIVLKPINQVHKELILGFRRKISEQVSLKLDESYVFHISISYTMEPLTETEKETAEAFFTRLQKRYQVSFPVLVIDQPIFALYNDMSEFRDYKLGRKNLGVASFE